MINAVPAHGPVQDCIQPVAGVAWKFIFCMLSIAMYIDYAFICAMNVGYDQCCVC